MSRKLPAIILPARPTAFALINCMRMADIPATVLVPEGFGYERRSLYARKVFLKANVDSEAEVLGALEALRGQGGVILPSKDAHLLMLSRHRASLEKDFSLCMPSDELVRGLTDKALEIGLAQRAGLDVPPTVIDLPKDAKELTALLGTTSIILKPRLPYNGYVKTYHARGLESLERIYESLEGRLDGLIAQAHLPGGAETLWICTCVFDARHDLVSAFVYQKRRTNPVDNGITTVGVSTVNARVVELARRFGKSLGYVGPADLEFKYDAATDRYSYIETNTRFTLSCEFAARCGLNQAEQGYWTALGGSVPPQAKPHAVGVYYTNIQLDLSARRKAGESWARILRETLPLFLRRRVGLVSFALRDPWPYIRRRVSMAKEFALLPARWSLRRMRAAMNRARTAG